MLAFCNIELTCCCSTDDANCGGNVMMDEMIGPVNTWCNWFSCSADAGTCIVSTRGWEFGTPGCGGNVIWIGTIFVGSKLATTSGGAGICDGCVCWSGGTVACCCWTMGVGWTACDFIAVPAAPPVPFWLANVLWFEFAFVWLIKFCWDDTDADKSVTDAGVTAPAFGRFAAAAAWVAIAAAAAWDGRALDFVPFD